MLVNGARVQPDASGALFWPGERTIVVSDLHFEKGSAHAARGHGLVPPYDTAATLQRLELVIARYHPQRLIALGDSFHDQGAFERLSDAEVERLRRLVAKQETIWIAGNHDPAPPQELGGTIMSEIAIGPLHFRHEPQPGAAAGEVAGHLHPKARVSRHGRTVSARAFASDGIRLIMPAFGAFAGGLDVTDMAFRPLFRRQFHAWMAVNDRVYAVPSNRLLRREDVPAG
ncbi:MAG: ligase-associated DNA damage response endonuclease PdeM [Pseudomonadota bacterium]|nr:ligase-associated DNA damage response endonuclease PdeM [Pseudomonadota bacterium]